MKRLLAVAAALAGLAAAGAQPAPPEGVEFAAPDGIETHLIKVLRTTNKAQTNRYVPKVYNFTRTNPYDALRFIARPLDIEEGAWFIFGKPQSPDDPGSVRGGKVVVVAPVYQLPYLDKLMATIDAPGLTTSSGDEAFYYRPAHRHVEDTEWVGLLSALGQGPDNVADQEVNAFLFYDSPGAIEDVKRWLPLVDQPPAQAMIEATIYEIELDNDDRIGLDYAAWKRGPGRDLFRAGLFSEREHIPTLEGGEPLFDSGVPAGTYSLPGHRFQSRGRYCSWIIDVPSAYFDFLVSKQKARVLTSAKLLARNGVPAALEAVDSIFYWGTAGADDSNEQGQAREREMESKHLEAELAGVTLTVTPLIGTDGINLSVQLNVVSHTGFDETGRPLLVSRAYGLDEPHGLELRVKDGEEVILGGYSRQMMIQQASKVPILGSIPVVGWLFGGEENLVKRRELVAVLRAQTVRDYSAMGGQGTQVNAALIRARALRQVPTKTLPTEAGFDQWLLDSEGTEQ